MDISPLIWGRHGWMFLFAIAYSYDNTNKKQYKRFFNQLRYVLPCAQCRNNYTSHINKKDYDAAFLNNKTLMDWLLSIRNHIRKEYNQDPLTLNDVFDELNKKNTSSNTHIILIAVIVVLCIVILYLIKND